MRSFLVDTNIISETALKTPNARVIDWWYRQPMIVTASVSIFEIASGIERLATGAKRDELEQWFGEFLATDIQILSFDAAAALAASTLQGAARRAGRAIEFRDLFILAIAKSRSLTIATRNTRHFSGFGVPIFDPFQDIHQL